MLNEVMNGITVALPFVVGVGGVGVLASGYVKASPDTALIISGLRKKPKVLIGKAGIKVPFFERMDKLSLKLIPLDIKTGDAVPTADCINIYVDSAVNVKVGSTSEMVEIAAQNFLNKSTQEIGDIVTEVLEGNIREIICTMKLRELIGDRKTFVEKVSENVIPDLKKMGLELVSFNVQRFSDENHVINDLGIDNISQIKKDAAIAKANADKENTTYHPFNTAHIMREIDDFYDKKKGRKKGRTASKIFIAGLIAVLLVVVISVFQNKSEINKRPVVAAPQTTMPATSVPTSTATPYTVTIENYVGLEKKAAVENLKKLKDEGLTVRFQTKYSKKAKGTVIEQNIPAGKTYSDVSKKTLRLTISKGKKKTVATPRPTVTPKPVPKKKKSKVKFNGDLDSLS